MGEVFSKPKPAPVMQAPPPKVPVIEDATAASQASADAARRRRGSMASILTSAVGVGDSPVGKKTLLGS